jgi:hypothetical protein
MPGLGDGYRNHVLDAFLGAGFTRSANVYVALLSTSITSSAGGGTELTGSGYVRVAVPNNGTYFGPAAAGSTRNLLPITFPTVTGTAWLSTAGFAVYDDATSVAAVNLIVWGNITTPRVYGVGQTATFDPGSLVVSVS